jgi:hypothetical protein
MPLSREQIAELKMWTKRALKKELKFFYCMAGADREPVLVIDKKIVPTQIKAIKQTAKKKIFVRGTVGNYDGNLAFRTERPDKGKFKKNLKIYFGRSIPLLKKAQVISTE